jgi:coenzyme F420 hydrogenase subunit beta
MKKMKEETKKTKNVEDASKNLGLCMGCGTCEAICPEEAITLDVNKKGFYVPSVNEKKCTNCGLCVSICPGRGINFKEMDIKIFNEMGDQYLGNFIRTYLGHSTDNEIRYNGSSGGFITALALYAIDKKIVDGVIVTKIGKDEKPITIITNDRDEILKSSSSKYAPAPVNTIIKEINKTKEKKYLFIGLPCQIHGLLKAEKYFPDLKEKIWLIVGLFCGGTTSFVGTDFIRWLYKIDKDKWRLLRYRGGDWPGTLDVKTKENICRNIPLIEYYPYLGAYFCNPRCRLCIDHTAGFADISVGDPWLPGFTDPLGSSVIISRTKNGENILSKMKNVKVIDIQRMPVEKVVESQVDAILYKKSNLSPRGIAIGTKIPDYGVQVGYGYPKYVSFLQTLVFSKLSEMLAYNKTLWPLLKLYHRTVTFAFGIMTGRIKWRYREKLIKRYID